MWPDFEAREVPILSITNGVHAQTWTSLGMAELFDKHLSQSWRSNPQDAGAWQDVYAIDDRALWETHQTSRQRLGTFRAFTSATSSSVRDSPKLR